MGGREDQVTDTQADLAGQCQRPCDPNAHCPDCAPYWDRMRAEGFWMDGIGWTDAGLREMRK